MVNWFHLKKLKTTTTINQVKKISHYHLKFSIRVQRLVIFTSPTTQTTNTKVLEIAEYTYMDSCWQK